MIIVTTHQLLVYDTPSTTGFSSSPQDRKGKKKQQALREPKIKQTIDHPSLPVSRNNKGSSSTATFRGALYVSFNKDENTPTNGGERFMQGDDTTLFTISNSIAPRSRGSKMQEKNGFVCKWEDWKVARTRQVGKRGVTCCQIRYVCTRFEDADSRPLNTFFVAQTDDG